jgi:hypothetical protein
LSITSPPTSRSPLISLAAAALALSIIASGIVGWLNAGVPLGRHAAITDIAAESDRTYTGDFNFNDIVDSSDHAGDLLFLVEQKPIGPLSFLHGVFGGFYAFEWLETLVGFNLPMRSGDVWVRLGPGHTQLEEIRQKGNGRYAVVKGRVYFSLLEGSDLATVRLELVQPYIAPETIGVLRRAFFYLTILLAAGFLLLCFWPTLYWLNRVSPVARNLLPGIGISAAMLLLAAGIAEIYFRAKGEFPRNQIRAPIAFVPDVGFLYQPDSQIRWTNGMDFWTEQGTNSLGFADREPTIPKPPGTFRILLVGDSFVEALQVPLEQKLQTQLVASLSRRLIDRRFDAVAMGFMGTGQANQLAYMEKFGDRIKPDLVILLVVDNDFANNSVILESVRRGWNPDYPPLLFFRNDSDGECRRIPISPQYQLHELSAGTAAERMMLLETISPEYADELRGWDPDTMDFIFFSSAKLPRVFEEAVGLTRCAFAAWKQHAVADHFRLIVIATDNVTDGAGVPQMGQIDRLKAVTLGLDLPMLDLYPLFTARGGTAAAHWKHDGHWNATGHQWAAEAIADFLERGGYLHAD